MKLLLSNKVQVKNLRLMDAGEGQSQHPNMVPFTCSLFGVDVPSNGSPEGADGKLIRISSEVCDACLPTFVGMAVNIDYGDGLAGHDTRFKVGVITKVYRTLDGMARADGYIWAKDFPDVVATIRYYNNLAAEWNDPDFQMGTSIEIEAKVQMAQDDENILDVLEFIGTGAAILFAETAAYTTTSFAARNNPKEGNTEMKEEDLKKLLGEFKSDIQAGIDKSIGEVKTEVGAIKTEVETLKAANAPQQQQPVPTAAETPEMKAARERAEKAEKDLADLKAKYEQNPEPQRKTVSASQQLLSKYPQAAGADGNADYKSFCAHIDQLNLPSSESIKLKLQAKAAFKEEK